MYVAIYDLHRSQRVFADSIDYSTPTTNAELRHLAISPNGNRLLIGSWAGYVIYYARTDTNASWRRRQSVSINSRVYWTDMDSAGTLVVVGNQERGLQLYSLADTTMTMLWETGTPGNELQIPLDGGQRTVSMTPNGELMNCTTRGCGMGGGRMVVLKRSGEVVFNRAIHAIRDQTSWTSPNGISPELWFGRVSADGSRIVFAGWSGYAYFYKLKDLIPPNLTSPLDGAANIELNTSLSWASVASATSYTLQVSTRTDFSAFTVNQSGITGTSYALTGLSAGTEYFWRVSAENATSTSGFSVTRRFRTVTAPPPPPQLVSPEDNATGVSTSPTVSWNSVGGATSYTVQVSMNTGFTSYVVNQSGIMVTSLALSNLSNGTRYYWRVSASNAGGASPNSGTRNFTTIVGAPTIPTLVAPSAGATGISTTPTLSWNPAIGADSYNLQLSTSSSFGSLVVNRTGLTSTSSNITGLLSSTTYFWRVSATNAGGTSPFSDARSFTTSPPSSVELIDGLVPKEFDLSQIFPNPFNPSTHIRFSLPKEALVRVHVLDASGRVIRELVRERKSPGTYLVRWDGRGEDGVVVTSGVYFYRFESPAYNRTMKMVFLK